jgi:DNA invertase Pin-like site-specific DNA recombinase
MPRRYIEGHERRREHDLWRKVGEPGPGAHCRGYVRFSHEAGHFGLTTEGQKDHIRAYVEARQWILDGFDVEPARSAKYEDIEERPVFAQHLQAAERGEFQVSLCYLLHERSLGTQQGGRLRQPLPLAPG